MSAVTDLQAGFTGTDASDVTLVNNALEEIRASKLPVPHFVCEMARQLYARLVAEIVALTP